MCPTGRKRRGSFRSPRARKIIEVFGNGGVYLRSMYSKRELIKVFGNGGVCKKELIKVAGTYEGGW